MGGIDPKTWGSSAWRLLHDLSFYVANMNVAAIHEQAKEFFTLLRHVLPCSKCQLAYDRHLLRLPFPVDSKAVPRWVFDLHNRVNKDVKSNSATPSWDMWHISYPREMGEHGLKQVWPFIQSIAETYPIGRLYDKKVYIKSMERFFILLWGFLSDMMGYSKDVSRIRDLIDTDRMLKVLPSAKLFKAWVTMIGRRIYASPIEMEQCDRACMKNY